jgi:hypothetical protein
VKRARELIYTAERQASRDVSLAGLRPKPGSSHSKQRTNDKRLDVSLLFRLPLGNSVFETALGDQLVSQIRTTPAIPRTLTP